jgi:DNA modification methylase
MINQIHIGHCLEVLKRIPDNSVHCCITSPPYFGLRDYQLDPAKWPEISFSPMPGLPPLYVPAQECCLGLEKDIWAYVGHMVLVFREVWRVLRGDGTLWLNLGDSYVAPNGRSHGHSYNGKGPNSQLSHMAKAQDIGIKREFGDIPAKNLTGIPWRVAYALQADGWYLRSDVIWHKPNPMPESVTDRPTKAHEYVFLFSKSERYFYDVDAIREPVTESSIERARYGWNGVTDDNSNGSRSGSSFQKMARGEAKADILVPLNGRNKRTVWTVATQPYAAAHFATFPPKLIEPMILAGCSEGGTVLDPFMGSGTTAKVALANRRNYIGIDANPTYAEELAPERLNGTQIKLV